MAKSGRAGAWRDYSPLWHTVFVRWKPGITPKVLTSDNKILALAKKGELTATTTSLG